MTVLAFALNWALTVLMWAYFGRFFLELALSLNSNYRPKGLFLVLAELLMTITDPPLKFLRRFLKPVRLGAIQLDLAWTVLILLLSMAQQATNYIR